MLLRIGSKRAGRTLGILFRGLTNSGPCWVCVGKHNYTFGRNGHEFSRVGRDPSAEANKISAKRQATIYLFSHFKTETKANINKSLFLPVQRP